MTESIIRTSTLEEIEVNLSCDRYSASEMTHVATRLMEIAKISESGRHEANQELNTVGFEIEELEDQINDLQEEIKELEEELEELKK